MKRIAALAVLATLTVSGFAQKFPVETDSMRRNVTKTSGNVLIKNARILTVTKGIIEGGDLLILGGKIKAIGKGLEAPAGTTVIDATGKVVTPGIVDDFGDDRRAPGRQLVDGGHVQISVITHRQGAGNRGGGHHQHMGPPLSAAARVADPRGGECPVWGECPLWGSLPPRGEGKQRLSLSSWERAG